MASQNPFFVGGPVPPEHFVGRTSEVNAAFDQILSRSHLAIWGSPGMGKSSFLNFLTASQAWQERGLNFSEAVIVYLNCIDINPFTPLAFWREVLNRLKEKFDGDVSLQSDIDNVLREEAVGKDDLCRVLRKTRERNKFLLLLLDDYDTALHPNENYTEAEMWMFLLEFRNLTVHSDEGRYIPTIVTSFRRLNELGPKPTPSGSPWYNHYKFQALKPFTDNEVAALLSKIPTEFALTPAQKEGIRELANGHPALLQNACNLLYNALRVEQTPAAETFAKDFVSATEQYFRDAWTFSTEVEQMVLMLIALSHLEGRLNRRRHYNLGDVDIILSQMDRELCDLEERGVICRTTTERGKNVYSFTSSIMEWWVIKEIENSKDEAELEQREKVFLNLSRKQLKQIKNVIRQVWEHKDAMVSIAEWVGKLSGAFAKGIAAGGRTT